MSREENARINGRLGGRPAGSFEETTLFKKAMRQRLIQLAHERQEEIFTAAMDLALGYWKESEFIDPVTGETKRRVYKKGPNGEMLGYLLDQTIDKAVQNVNVDSTVRLDKPLTNDEAKLVDQALAYAAGPIPEAIISIDDRGQDQDAGQDK